MEVEQSGTSAGINIRDPNGRAGDVARSFDPGTGTFKMDAAFREAKPTPPGAVSGPIQGMIENILPVPPNAAWGARHSIRDHAGHEQIGCCLWHDRPRSD